MKLLVLGGTKFLGRAVAEAALERGHELTLFNRGVTNADLFPDVENAADAPVVDGVGLTPEREAELLAAWRAR